MNATSLSLLSRSVYTSELLIDLVLLPLSAFNIYIVISTAVMHLNLKIIICAQSLGVLLYSIERSIELLILLLLYLPRKAMEANGLKVLARSLSAIQNVGISLSSWVGLILVMERIYATVNVKHYEGMKSPLFNIIWMGFLVRENYYKHYVKYSRSPSAYLP